MATQVYKMAEQYDPNNYNSGFGGYSEQPNSGGNSGYGDQINGDGQPPLTYSPHQLLNVSGDSIKRFCFLSKLLFFSIRPIFNMLLVHQHIA